MKRLKKREVLALAVFVPLWGLCIALSLRAAIRGTAYPPIVVDRARDEGAYPVLTGLRSTAAEEAGLRLGDSLVSAGGVDLRGAGPVGLSIAFAAYAAGPPVPVVFERDGVRTEVSLRPNSYRLYWPRLPASLAFGATAVLLLLRARSSPMVGAVVLTNMSVAVLLACTFAGGPVVTGLSIVAHVLSFSIAAPVSVRASLLLPEGRLPQSALGRYGPLVFAVLGPLDASRFYDFPLPREVGAVATSIVGLASVATHLAIIFRNYRRASPVGRRQLRWVVFGVCCAFVPPIVATILATLDPRFTPVLVVSMSALGLNPIFLWIAIARYNLFDVDRVITATASYTILAVCLVAAVLSVVPRLASALSGAFGLNPGTAQVALSLLMAGVLVPLQRRLQPEVERLFFAERYDLEQAFERLLAELSTCTGAQALTRLAGERLDDMLRPERTAIYARMGGRYAPVFVRGAGVPAAFEDSSLLVAALRDRSAPLAAGGLVARQRDAPAVRSFDRAALETLGVPLVVPIRRGGALAAFLCLGPKRSRDVYTSTDVALLAAVADKISGELARFDQAEILREARAMQEALRRYVPGAVAEELVHGRAVEPGEREITVLFVDIRGYTSYSESRKAEEVFSTVNRYAETVSEVVRRHGGHIVEFSGDGLMAVFGAPQPLARKERAAVSAALDLVAALGAVHGGDAAIAVGVGIATGAAFVGNVQAVDRLIWTAIGNTTNLAARLQALTRDLDAAVVIDGATWKGAGDAARTFGRREQVAIRGRSQPIDCYVLPLTVAASSAASASVRNA